eukprot:11771192-Alexandrium_andersonii.AAC.1
MRNIIRRRQKLLHRDSWMLSRTRLRMARIFEARKVMRKWGREFRKSRAKRTCLQHARAARRSAMLTHGRSCPQGSSRTLVRSC